jgi:cholesterol oxidase
MRKVAVIGSGFGGAVAACRLAESKQFDVHVLERGARYGRNAFPRRPDQIQEAFWDPDDGLFGLFEYHAFEHSGIDVVSASGLGGGSLIYANVLYRMPAEFFAAWPGGITRVQLDPYYARVLAMLEARPYPIDEPGSPYRATPKTLALAEAVAKISSDPHGHPAMRMEWPDLAIQFGPRVGEERANAQGIMQTTCVMCGECVIGCNIHAKNTLDLTYLARAEHHGATLHTWCEVQDVRPGNHGRYTVTYGDPRTKETCSKDYDLVIVAAGSLGSTRLLLQGRQHFPQLSQTLGTRWSANGDLLGFVMQTDWPVYPTQGPVITGAIRVEAGGYADGFPTAMWIEDGGFPRLLAWYILGQVSGKRPHWAMLRGVYGYLKGLLGLRRESNIGNDLSPFIPDSRLITHVLPLLGMGRDLATGRITLKSRGAHRRACLHLDWSVNQSALHYERLHHSMQRIATALGGRFVESPLGLLHRYISVHPLGGCPMGDSATTGVVDARTAQVFGYDGLYIMDGSIMPMAIGPNPALTIAALAEMYAERLCQ